MEIYDRVAKAKSTALDDVLMRQFLKKNALPAQAAEIQKEIDELKDLVRTQGEQIAKLTGGKTKAANEPKPNSRSGRAA